MPVASNEKPTKKLRRILIVKGSDPFPPTGLPPLDIDSRIDLTKPICEQAQKLRMKDEAQEARRLATLRRSASPKT
ncbi:hypothetical protein SAMN05421770_106112 [Granulicella rosea]|uniref:Uncharacterized protein n=1 Tax=Granulicella rosea TaxID=474952 RepID=A0A239L726_9BACT|nr:hypothetical protein SAMN05421770_106112 [Granulicella rosea]